MKATAKLASLFVLWAGSLPWAAGPVSGQELTVPVTVQTLVRAEEGRLRILTRIPLEGLGEVPWPLHGPGFLTLQGIEPVLRTAAEGLLADSVVLLEDGRPLGTPEVAAVQLSLPSDASFGSWETALAHVTGPGLPPEVELYWQQAVLDVLLEVPVESEASDFALEPRWGATGVQTTLVLRWVPPGGEARTYRLSGSPGRVHLDPRWHQVVRRLGGLGFVALAGSLDPVLLLLCLLLPFRGAAPLALLAAAFVSGRWIGFLGAGAGLAPNALWFGSLAGTLTALSVVWLALGNVVGARIERRWVAAFAFGVVHGFAFWLPFEASLQWTGGARLAGLFAFGVGLDAGALVVGLAALGSLALLLRSPRTERVAVLLVSVVVAHTAWHRMTARGAELVQYDLRWPAPGPLLLVTLIRWLMLAVVVAGALLALRALLARLRLPGEGHGATPAGDLYRRRAGPRSTPPMPSVAKQ